MIEPSVKLVPSSLSLSCYPGDAMTAPGRMLQLAAKPSRPPGGRRVAEAEVQRRLSLVERLLAEGVPRSDIVAQVGLPARTTDSYIARVRQAWQANALQGREGARTSALGRLMALREQMVEARAWGPLVRVEQLICDLQGLRNGQQGAVEVPGPSPGIVPPALTVEVLKERAPLLILACVRVVANSEDTSLIEHARGALTRSLSMLEKPATAPSVERA